MMSAGNTGTATVATRLVTGMRRRMAQFMKILQASAFPRGVGAYYGSSSSMQRCRPLDGYVKAFLLALYFCSFRK
eukprot:COSAG05_NODE_2715_length_2733_cov_19.057327_4_plen_75_part_00